MQKPSVVLWDLLWKLVSLVASPEDQIESAIQLYRSYYKEKGVYEAQLFPQIKDLLAELAQQYPLYITTTKNTPTAVI